MDSQIRHDFTKSHVPPRNQIARSEFVGGDWTRDSVGEVRPRGSGHATSDPQVAAALIDKAAEIKDRADHPSPDKSPWTPDVDQET
jgi:hypothetical protein